jgi:crossover junction endodeoxyribonuclease RuvC
VVIARLRPDALAVEDVFHAVNARSALVLGHVRGVVLLCGAEAGLAVSAFPPATVKAQVTGFGRAEKRQVALMVARLRELARDAPAGDATDALAVALCHAHLHGASAAPRSLADPGSLGGRV